MAQVCENKLTFTVMNSGLLFNAYIKLDSLSIFWTALVHFSL